jgi:transcriptional regulator with XRE-family HTH domain
MISKEVRAIFSDFEQRHGDAPKERALQGVFIDLSLAIARIRNSLGLSQRALAKKLGTSHPTIVRWETPGHSAYNLAKLVELAEALEHSLEIRFVPKAEIRTVTTDILTAEWGDLRQLRALTTGTHAPLTEADSSLIATPAPTIELTRLKEI